MMATFDGTWRFRNMHPLDLNREMACNMHIPLIYLFDVITLGKLVNRTGFYHPIQHTSLTNKKYSHILQENPWNEHIVEQMYRKRRQVMNQIKMCSNSHIAENLDFTELNIKLSMHKLSHDFHELIIEKISKSSNTPETLLTSTKINMGMHSDKLSTKRTLTQPRTELKAICGPEHNDYSSIDGSEMSPETCAMLTDFDRAVRKDEPTNPTKKIRTGSGNPNDTTVPCVDLTIIPDENAGQNNERAKDQTKVHNRMDTDLIEQLGLDMSDTVIPISENKKVKLAKSHSKNTARSCRSPLIVASQFQKSNTGLTSSSIDDQSLFPRISQTSWSSISMENSIQSGNRNIWALGEKGEITEGITGIVLSTASDKTYTKTSSNSANIPKSQDNFITELFRKKTESMVKKEIIEKEQNPAKATQAHEPRRAAYSQDNLRRIKTTDSSREPMNSSHK